MTADGSGVPFVVVRRGGEMESEHAISFAIADAAGEVRDEHDGDRFFYLRSAAKPLIATAVIASGAVDSFGLSDAELAIVAGSHAGTPRHLAVVRGLLEKIGLDERALRCGARPVLDESTAFEMCAHGELPTAIHNNCSGKHAGILALVRHRDLDLASYIASGHPAEQEILAVSADLLGLPLPELTVGIDGCGIPAVGCSIREAALGFARMASGTGIPERLREPLARVFSAMRSYPENVSGDGRFDTDLMRAAATPIVAKGGAEGVHVAIDLAAGRALCSKVRDGNSRAIPPFVIEKLAAAGIIDAGALPQLAAHREPVILTYAGAPAGDMYAVV